MAHNHRSTALSAPKIEFIYANQLAKSATVWANMVTPVNGRHTLRSA
jgi:hypothetical protein